MQNMAQIITQIPKECKVATQAIHIMPAANQTLKNIQQVYMDLWNAKYKNKIQANKDNVALYADVNRDRSKQNWKKFKRCCRYCSIQGHKEHECCKKKATEKAENSNKLVESKTEKDATDFFVSSASKRGTLQETAPKRKAAMQQMHSL